MKQKIVLENEEDWIKSPRYTQWMSYSEASNNFNDYLLSELEIESGIILEKNILLPIIRGEQASCRYYKKI